MTTSEKISATLPRRDLAFLNSYMERTGTTRSGALHEAVYALREKLLEEAYAEADAEWYADSAAASAWESTSTDGLENED